MSIKTNVSVQKLLLKKLGTAKRFSAFAGLVVGVVAVLLCVQLFSDVNDMLGSNEKSSQHEYLQLNKKVGYGATLGLSSTDFSAKEIEHIKKQPFIRDVGSVLSNNFKVSIEGGIGIPFYTELFLQAVPNHFIDIDTSGFHWDETAEEVPLIVSTHFFNLYNHGFAPSQGLPSLPKSALKQKSFVLNVRGNQGVKKLRCRIYGYTDRINSILVPTEFLNWANKNYSSSEKASINMLIVEVDDTGDSRLVNYLENKSFAVNKDRLRLDKTKMILEVVISVFLILGLVILCLSVLQILSFSQLVIAQNTTEINLLFTLGYHQKMISAAIFKSYFKLLLVSVGVCIGILDLLFYALRSFLADYNFDVPSVSTVTVVSFLALIGGLVLIIHVNIFRYLKNSKTIES